MLTKMQSMTPLWLLPILSLLGLQAARGSPLASASSGASSTVSGAPTISTAPRLSWTATVSANFTSQNPRSIDSSTKATNISGPVTVIKTLELIPQPVPNESPEGPSSSITSQQVALLTTSAPAQPRSSVEPSISSSPQVLITQPVDQSVKRPKLQPIIVGGITYAPVLAHHTLSNDVPWQVNSQASETNSKDIELHEYYEKHFSEMHGVDHELLESGEARGGLPPVVVGGLTYRPIGIKFKSGLSIQAPTNVATSTPETAKPATSSLSENEIISLPAQPGSMAASSPYPTNNRASSPTSVYSHSPTPLPGSSLLVLSSESLTALPGSSDFIYGGSTLLRESPTITVNSAAYYLNSPPFTIAGQPIIPASPSTFIIANQTFTAYPSGLAISGTEVFQGSTAITLSGTAISLGTSDIVIGTSTIPFASVTGLGAALSSGLSTIASATGARTAPTPTSTSVNNSQHESAAGQLKSRAGSIVIVWFVFIARTITMVLDI